MDDNSSKKSSTEDDIITNLPQDFINPILDRLPVKDAVRTSVLSKKWRYRWTTMRTLDLDCQFSKQFLNIGAYEHNGLIRVINQIMIHHQGPIFKFHLHIPEEINLDSFQEVDQWMLILSRNNVRVLEIINSTGVYRVPSSVFSCLELRKLLLSNSIFKPPLEFQGFPYLKNICLLCVNFGGNLAINLPRLKSLALHNCVNVNNFNIKAENLQLLWVICCSAANAFVLQFLHSEHLNAVYISLSESAKDISQVLSFTVDAYFLKFLAAEVFPKSIPHAVKCLEELAFQRISFGDLDQLQGVMCMLRNSPNLEVLRVIHMQMEPEADLELTSMYLESPDCLDQMLNMLQRIEMTSLEGSTPELLFIKLLLEHSPNLERMIIRPNVTADAEKRHNIAKKVLMYPRASTKAKVLLLDPEP